MPNSVSALCLALTWGLVSRTTGQSLATQETSSFPLPLAKVHAHNDYVHPVALFEALGEGICSIEADPWYVNGTLYVAHEAETLLINRTLESLYVEPLANLVAANEGYVYKASKYVGACTQIILLIDFKGGARYNSTSRGYSSDPSISALTEYDALDELLQQYQSEVPGLFTEWFANGTSLAGAINVYISGTRPSPAFIKNLPSRLAALDGRVPMDLYGPYDNTVYPLVSENWCCGVSGNDISILPVGADPLNLTSSQYQMIEQFTTLAHQQNRLIRYYGTPDSPAAWQLFFDINTDLVNTDFLPEIRSFIFNEMNNAALTKDDYSLAIGSPYTPGLSRAGLRPASFQGLRGMAACKDLQLDDELTSVPLGMALVVPPRQNCPFPDKVKKEFWSESPWYMKLALMLLHERELGETSRFAPYLKYLPTKFNTPFSWSDQELQQLGYPFVTQQVKEQRQAWQELWASFKRQQGPSLLMPNSCGPYNAYAAERSVDPSQAQHGGPD
ncbi:hypothetical protein WJX84_003329 [Apatococcus fuscideae]|uniref:Uncharacterized protein n=1 Tax=Apatococcus fuscideae TaxID=2026836 RepID=A0AAW1SW86_9CHLO